MRGGSPDDVRMISTAALDPEDVRLVLALADAAGASDGVPPLSEQVLLDLRNGGPAGTRHLIARSARDTVAGYAHLDLAGGRDAFAAELVVHPMQRRRGIGRALVDAVLGAARAAGPDGTADTADTAGTTGTTDPSGPDGVTGTTGGLDIWAHGDHPSAAALGLDLGFRRERVLWQLRYRMTGPLTEPALPDGVILRPFVPGSDEAAWLAVNARAFASHPEQGRWTAADLAARMAEPWFDPAGFLLAVAESDGRLLGFHWTKVHPPAIDRGEPLGEVYVLGVDPDTHGLGLGRALTLAGLRHLRSRGLHRIMLYVDESNTPAMGLYARLGFGRWAGHVTYRIALDGRPDQG
ncbi:mycothiol synthase [Plantactinospora sp. KBS50]|uniref:mycothiol synthase n=1 Tax=Plantactinospora sp. KBS50 TaxID=2024580 RepID=UPI0035155A69